MYQVFGFGGIPPKKYGMIDRWFPLNENQVNPSVPGISGIIEIYHHALSQVLLSGPSNFRDILKNVIDIVNSAPKTEIYHVLLILTDGHIDDIYDTIHWIVEASSLPLSIIIVGLGNGDFSTIEKLDADGALLIDWNDRQAVRDIVQFVPFRKFEGNPYLLAQEVLAELPKQVTEYMRSIERIPIIPELVPIDQIYAQNTFGTVEADPEAQYMDSQTNNYSCPQSVPPQEIISQQSQYQSLQPQINAYPEEEKSS